MEDTGLPSDSLRWLLQYLSDYWWGNIHQDVIDAMESDGAPDLVLDIMTEMMQTQGND